VAGDEGVPLAEDVEAADDRDGESAGGIVGADRDADLLVDPAEVNDARACGGPRRRD
jgi:hypothetical protein